MWYTKHWSSRWVYGYSAAAERSRWVYGCSAFCRKQLQNKRYECELLLCCTKTCPNAGETCLLSPTEATGIARGAWHSLCSCDCILVALWTMDLHASHVILSSESWSTSEHVPSIYRLRRLLYSTLHNTLDNTSLLNMPIGLSIGWGSAYRYLLPATIGGWHYLSIPISLTNRSRDIFFLYNRLLFLG